MLQVQEPRRPARKHRLASRKLLPHPKRPVQILAAAAIVDTWRSEVYQHHGHEPTLAGSLFGSIAIRDLESEQLPEPSWTSLTKKQLALHPYCTGATRLGLPTPGRKKKPLTGLAYPGIVSETVRTLSTQHPMPASPTSPGTCRPTWNRIRLLGTSASPEGITIRKLLTAPGTYSIHRSLRSPFRNMDSTSGIPGLLYANSKISRPDILDENTFFEWYDEEHIPELIGTSGFDSAFRFIDINTHSERPYLAVYPTKDFSFFQSNEFKGLKSLQSDKFPGTGAVAEVMDSTSRFDKLVQVYDPTRKGPGHTKCIISAQMKSASNPTAEEDIDLWYREEHLRLIAKSGGYLRTTRYKLAFSASFPPASEDDEVKPPVWLALHEFETETVDMAKLAELTITDWTKKIHETTEGIFIIYKLAKGFGIKDLFHGVEM